MKVLQKIPRKGSIPAKELASEVGKNEEVLGIFLLVRSHATLIVSCSSFDEDSHIYWNTESTWE
jgi:hypothetical protein